MADHKNIYQALDAARAEFPVIVKNRVNPHFKSKYADLQAILEAVTPALRANGLVLVQGIDAGELITSIIQPGDNAEIFPALHCTIPLPADTDPQKFGSAITYARRYGIVTLLGLVTEDDDDANAASPEAAPKRKATRGASEPAGAVVDPSGGWDSPAQRAAAHESLLDKIRVLPEDTQDELRKLSTDLGGMPLPKDKFQELERAVDLVGGTI
jgi:hypothetical protein